MSKEWDRLHPSTSRVNAWKKRNPDKKNAKQKAYYAQFRLKAHRHRHDWTIREIEMLDGNMTDRELSKAIGRTVQAIQMMRYRLSKKLEAGKVEALAD